MIEVKREAAESTGSVLRRFSKRVQGSGLIRKVKALKATERPLSAYKQKKSALTRLARRAAYERLKKLGKIANVARRY
jgi:ribosomal protein S21